MLWFITHLSSDEYRSYFYDVALDVGRLRNGREHVDMVLSIHGLWHDVFQVVAPYVSI